MPNQPVYAATPSHTGAGDVIFISVDGGNTFLQIMGTQNIQYASQKTNFEDVTSTTSLRNPNSDIVVLESNPVSEDPGNFTFDYLFNPNDPGQQLLDAATSAHSKLQVQHQYKALSGQSAGPMNAFLAWIEMNPQPSSDAVKTAKRSCSLKITGLITKNPAVSA